MSWNGHRIHRFAQQALPGSKNIPIVRPAVRLGFPLLFRTTVFLVLILNLLGPGAVEPSIVSAAPVAMEPAGAAQISYPTPPRFLTYPFNLDNAHPIIRGDTWIRNDGSAHQGVDYYRGDWTSFTILAAADGQAMYVPGNCTWGNYIEIKHVIGSETWWTLYAHVASPLIPADGAFHNVSRGQEIAIAGKTGYWRKNTNGTCDTSQPYTVIHLHFELSKGAIGAPNRVDPYGVYDKNNSGLYPGTSAAFTTNPPSYPGSAAPVARCSPPTNGIPRDNATFNDPSITFTWSPPSCVGLDSYTIRISNHSDIENSPFITEQTISSSATSFTYSIPSGELGKALYWSIWAHNSVGLGDKGGPWQFNVDTSTPPAPQPLPMGQWNVTYFRNKELTDQCASSTFTRTYIFSDWGEGAPAGGCIADNWGARFTRRISFAGGDYSWNLFADDWARIYVDNVLFVDQWNGASQHIEGHPLSAGDHDVRIEFADTAGSAKPANSPCTLVPVSTTSAMG